MLHLYCHVLNVFCHNNHTYSTWWKQAALIWRLSCLLVFTSHPEIVKERGRKLPHVYGKTKRKSSTICFRVVHKSWLICEHYKGTPHQHFLWTLCAPCWLVIRAFVVRLFFSSASKVHRGKATQVAGATFWQHFNLKEQLEHNYYETIRISRSRGN